MYTYMYRAFPALLSYPAVGKASPRPYMHAYKMLTSMRVRILRSNIYICSPALAAVGQANDMIGRAVIASMAMLLPAQAALATK